MDIILTHQPHSCPPSSPSTYVRPRALPRPYRVGAHLLISTSSLSPLNFPLTC
ncbi:uncharacterized protein LAESUDRAFT_732497 [Laetiporus sulphureus 93-53]|uniref:Uncharacterized protein n=1 Tax=Laetiporus sulphureus 93-53 TaxID=1314785 RepID=A0A165B4P9_9APHY|nr:uncharacterized protein LAESUDRAFT_732497 [Laetiporus sulphureus 93-53]KZT00231.1 hypothetical protein LAESUDRAFT_732497 [Laetiporus sulphureus 93-53]